jgi:hypothetical protein
MSHLVLVISMWDRLGRDQSDVIVREAELRSTNWADILECGSQMFWHDISEGWVLRIVNHTRPVLVQQHGS